MSNPSVTFRCKRSGNTVSFTNLNDIEGLRKHEGYDEVFPTQGEPNGKSQEVQETAEEVLIVKKRRGRPPAIPSFLGDLK
jgi:hypothetical protein